MACLVYNLHFVCNLFLNFDDKLRLSLLKTIRFGSLIILVCCYFCVLFEIHNLFWVDISA